MDNIKFTPRISIVMPVFNGAEYIRDTIDSIISQSYSDFECIIVNDGSTDETFSVIKEYCDPRIILQNNQHDFIDSLNRGITMSRGKYIARMDADDIMHPDRLKIQHAIMEAEPEITICSTWMKTFGEKEHLGRMVNSMCGSVDFPLLELLKRNFVYHPTVMMRKDFLTEHDLQYENYPYAEDYKLWFEIAKLNGKFYVESLPLVYYRISENQISIKKREEQVSTTEKTQQEIVRYIVEKNRETFPDLAVFVENLYQLKKMNFVEHNEIISLLQQIFYKNKSKMSFS